MAEDPRVTGELEFHYEKSGLFRVIHVDGAIGSLSPGTKLIHMSVYSERTPVPKVMVFEVNAGSIGSEVASKRVMRPGIFREVESDMVMSVETAIAMRDWLNDRIAEATKAGALLAKLT